MWKPECTAMVLSSYLDCNMASQLNSKSLLQLLWAFVATSRNHIVSTFRTAMLDKLWNSERWCQYEKWQVKTTVLTVLQSLSTSRQSSMSNLKHSDYQLHDILLLPGMFQNFSKYHNTLKQQYRDSMDCWQSVRSELKNNNWHTISKIRQEHDTVKAHNAPLQGLIHFFVPSSIEKENMTIHLQSIQSAVSVTLMKMWTSFLLVVCIYCIAQELFSKQDTITISAYSAYDAYACFYMGVIS